MKHDIIGSLGNKKIQEQNEHCAIITCNFGKLQSVAEMLVELHVRNHDLSGIIEVPGTNSVNIYSRELRRFK